MTDSLALRFGRLWFGKQYLEPQALLEEVYVRNIGQFFPFKPPECVQVWNEINSSKKTLASTESNNKFCNMIVLAKPSDGDGERESMFEDDQLTTAACRRRVAEVEDVFLYFMSGDPHSFAWYLFLWTFHSVDKSFFLSPHHFLDIFFLKHILLQQFQCWTSQ